MGVSPNDCQMTYFNRMFHYKPSSYWGTPIYGNPHIWKSLKIWDHHRSKGCDFPLQAMATRGGLRPTSVSWSSIQWNQWFGSVLWNTKSMNYDFFGEHWFVCLYIYTYIYIHTIHTRTIYIYTCRSCLYIYIIYTILYLYRLCVCSYISALWFHRLERLNRANLIPS